MTRMSTSLTEIGLDLTVLVAKSFENEVALFKKLTDLKIPFVAYGRSLNCSSSSWLDGDNKRVF